MWEDVRREWASKSPDGPDPTMAIFKVCGEGGSFWVEEWRWEWIRDEGRVVEKAWLVVCDFGSSICAHSLLKPCLKNVHIFLASELNLDEWF